MIVLMIEFPFGRILSDMKHTVWGKKGRKTKGRKKDFAIDAILLYF